MLTNYITDKDLFILYPGIREYLPDAQTSFEPQINKAFDILINDLYSNNINPMLCMKPLDLLNNNPQPNDKIVVKDGTVNYTGIWMKMLNRRRLILISNSEQPKEYPLEIKLYGSNNIQDINNYEEIETISITKEKQKTIILNKIYEYIRIMIIPGITYYSISAYIVDTNFDNAICYKALSIIFAGFSKGDDNYKEKSVEMENNYQVEMSKIKFLYDKNKTGILTEDDIYQKKWELVR